MRPRLTEVTNDLVELAREPKRLALIVLGCAGTTLGAALALWASVEAFGVPAAVGVLLYRVLTCWLPVVIGWPVMRWLTNNEMV